MSKVLGWIYLALGGLGLLSGLWTCYTLSVDHDPRAPDTLGWMVALFVVAGVTILLPLFIGGLGLVLGKAWGRVFALIASGVMVLIFPIGTVVGGVGLWVLLSGDKAA